MAKPIEIGAIMLKNVFGKYLDRKRISYQTFTMLSFPDYLKIFSVQDLL